MMYNPPHPGDVLKDGVFTGTDITIVDFAKRIGVTRVTLSRILNGKASVSPDMALRLSAALGGSAETWLHMQANYDLWQAQQKFRPTIEQLRLVA
ncbi:MAG: HigA family addiction module antitoxin [Sulfuricellaceae bacterium]